MASVKLNVQSLSALGMSRADIEMIKFVLERAIDVEGATSANTALAIVKRDINGDFSAGIITADLEGNATTASRWQAARNLSFTGDATGTGSVDGSADVATAITLAETGVVDGEYGSATRSPVFTVDAKGRITEASDDLITPAFSAITDTPTTATGYGIASIDNVPIGATTPAAGAFAGIANSGDFAFIGAARRITGDFSNATIANRVIWQSSTVNGNTTQIVMPNGTATTANWQAFNGTDPANASQAIFGVSATEVLLSSSKQGAGTYLPLSFYVSGAIGAQLDTSANFALQVAGAGLRVKEGANAKQGTAVLVGGAKTVANTSVTANSRIFLTSNADGGTPGWLRVSARVAGTSFTITSSNALDTSTVAYEIFEPT